MNKNKNNNLKTDRKIRSKRVKRTNVSNINNSTNKIQRFYDNGRSYLACKDGSLLVLSNSSGDMQVAPAAIKVRKGLYIELGRSLSQFTFALSEANIPVIFVRVNKINDLEVYNIVVLNEGSESKIIAKLTLKNGIIISLSRVTDSESVFKLGDSEGLGAIWRVAIAKSSDMEETKARALNTVKVMIRQLPNHNIKVKYQVSQITVQVTGEEVNHEYVFYLNENTWRYELILIKLIEEQKGS